MTSLKDLFTGYFIKHCPAEVIIKHITEDPGALHALAQALEPFMRQMLEALPPAFDFYDSNNVVTRLRQEYTLVEIPKPGFHWAILDFSNARNGDTFDLKLAYHIDGQWKLTEHWRIENQQKLPVFLLSNRFAPALRLTIRQEAGIPRLIQWQWYTRYARMP